MEAYEKAGVQFVIAARKTAPVLDELKAAEWKPSPDANADGQCEFRYRAKGWSKEYRFIALRYAKNTPVSEPNKAEQYQLSDAPDYSYRVSVTNMERDAVALLA